MDKHPHHQNGSQRGGRANLASCVVATAFLSLFIITFVVVFFVVFRPRDPTIQVDKVQLPGFVASNGSMSFTFAQHVAVRNPNIAGLWHYDSTLQLVHAGNQVGFMFIPAGEIAGGSTQYMSASFAVHSFPLASTAGVSSVQMESRMKIRGRVKVLKILTHHVETTAWCRVGISAQDGSILRLRC